MTRKVLHDLLHQISQLIKPSLQEQQGVTQFLTTLQTGLQRHFNEAGVQCDVQIHGSIARDTWLRKEEAEIDVFLVMPPTPKNTTIQHVLDLVKTFVGRDWQERYADHPYLQANIQGFQIDFVPCYKITKHDALISAVDRSPLHTQLMVTRLNNQLKQDVRLLKQFMLGTGLYGAEIKIGGFSGYLCELLILHYGSFLKTLQHVSTWKNGEMIDIDDLWHERQARANQEFRSPLIVIDPVDAHRNVASAVTSQRMGELIMAARLFLQNPSKAFFFPESKKNFKREIETRLHDLQFDVLAISFSSEETAPDILWGQLHKTQNSIAKYLQRHNFTVFTSAAWSDEQRSHALIFSLESLLLSVTKKHRGPPFDANEATSFLVKHINAPSTNLGPWIGDGRWMVGRTREYPNARILLTEQLTRNGGQAMGVARGFVNSLKHQHTILVNREIISLSLTHPQFLPFFMAFLLGRPPWLHPKRTHE